MMDCNEKRYWQDKAALLDPKAYVFKTKIALGSGYSETVPDGECWYFLNAFFVRIGGGDAIYNHRVPDIDKATPIGAGTKIEFHADSSFSMYYTCRPSLVICADQRYQDDPKGLYFLRLARMNSLSSFSARVHVPAGAPYGTSSDEALPTDFEGALCLSYSNHDVSWGGVANQYSAMNLGNEISDDHQNRIGERLMFPFSRSVFPRLRARGGSVGGAPGSPYMKGNVQITYCKLPADW